MLERICKYLLVCVLSIFWGSIVSANEPLTAIIYPQTPSFKRFFTDVITAIQSNRHSFEIAVPVNDANELDDINTLIQQLPAKPVQIFALGRQVSDALKNGPYQDRLTVGVTYFKPTEFRGVSLSVDSVIIAERIHTLLPGVKKLFVIDSAVSAIDLTTVKSSSIPYVIMPGKDPAFNAKLLVKLIEEDATSQDAIFVPPTMSDDLLFDIAQISWEKKIILISPRLSHLDNGVLIAFYPDYNKLGLQISNLSHAYENLQNFNIAYHKKVAEHLGIQFDEKILRRWSVEAH